MINKILIGILVLFLSSPVWAAYTTVTCTNGETGTCRRANSCSQADVQSAVTASASGGNGNLDAVGNPRTGTFDGDGVYIPSCSTTSWGNSAVSWSNKNILIKGAGPTSTNVSNGGFSITSTTKNQWRISNIGFSGTPSIGLVYVNPSGYNGSTYSYGFRIDHLTVNYPSGSPNMIWISGPIWGVIDNLNVTYGTGDYHVFLEQSDYLNSECPASPVSTAFMGEYSGRTIPLGLGTNSAVYVEDSTFTGPSSGGWPVSDSESGGQRWVFRHNTVTGNIYFYAHWSRGNVGYCQNGEWGGHKMEMYNNSINGNGYDGYPIRWEAGTGVVFNNQFTGFSDLSLKVDEARGCGGSNVAVMYDCNGTRAWDVNAGDANAPGWPCAGQIGTGCVAGNCARNNLDNVPLILWNNGTQAGCATGGACTNSFGVSLAGTGGGGETCTREMANYIKSTAHTASGKWNGAVDYSDGNTSKPATVGTYTNSYTAYTYPHPLRGEGTPPESPPPLRIHSELEGDLWAARR